MKQTNILITGAASYLASSIIKKYTNYNKYRILLTSRSIDSKLTDMVNDNCKYLSGINLLNVKDVQKLREFIVEYFDSKFSVINCVGYFPKFSLIHQSSFKIAKKNIESNYLCVFNLANQLLPLMIDRAGGHFIAFSSHTNYQNYPEMVAFTSSKIALECLIKGIANEYGQYGILSNIFALATLNTDIERKLKPHGDFKNWLNLDEVSESVFQLIHDNNSLLNGNVIHLYKYSESYFHQSYYDRIK